MTATQHNVPPVRIRDLQISYQAGTSRVRVVDDINLELHAGRTVGVVGESGSGKSTVGRTLLGHLRPGSAIDTGTVEVLGEDVFALPPETLREFRGAKVALVPQNAGHSLTPSMRIGAQITEALTVHGLPAPEARIHELLRQVHLPDPKRLVDRYPHELSGGQQQRVAIAMAIAPGPEILVLDEPTTALDVITQAAVLALINELRDELRMSVLIVSHDLGVVSAISDDIVVMREGSQVEKGATAEVLANPREKYTRDLLASAPRIEDEGVAPHPLPAEVVLRCENLAVRYPRAPRRAVSEFGVDVHHSETVALVGESGSGKSTVATALAGLVHTEAGTMLLRDVDGDEHDLSRPAAARPPAVRRSVQMVFQNADLALNPRRTVRDAVARPLKIFRGIGRGTRQDEEVDRLLVEVGLGPEFARRLPGQLSGGQRQRVGIARALAARPSLLIADEPTTALDVSVQAEVLDLLDDIRERYGLATLFISHDLAVVRRLAHRIVVMRSGIVVESAPSDALFSDPRHPYTRTLLESVVEAGHARLPDAEIDSRHIVVDPTSPIIMVGENHYVRADEGVDA